MKHPKRFTRRWRLLVWAASLTIIFGAMTLGDPEMGSAMTGCSVMIGCAGEGACPILDGDKCSEEGCTNGVQNCAADTQNQCASYPGCDILPCKVHLCSRWWDEE